MVIKQLLKGGDIMARFDFDGLDDVMKDLEIIEIDCPVCNKPFEFNLSDIGSTVVCPHCNAGIELEGDS